LVSDIPAGDGKLVNLFLRCICLSFNSQQGGGGTPLWSLSVRQLRKNIKTATIPNVVFDQKVLLAGAAAGSAVAGRPFASRCGAHGSERGYIARHTPGDITPGIGEQLNSCSSNISADARSVSGD
jgi:hypothetical protein